jgi:hypothetical protein
MTYWIKLYTEILNDPKVGLLTNDLKWRFTEALLLAGNEEQDGYLPATAHAAFMAHTSEAELVADWRSLERAGLLAETDDGWLVINFAKRQAPSEVAERVRLHRERKNLLQERYGNLHATTPDTDTDTETDSESDTELINISSTDNFQNVRQLIEKHTGMPSMPGDVPALQELAAMDDLQEGDVIGAVAFFKDNGNVARGAAHLLKSIKYKRAMRIQERANAPPGKNGRSRKTGAIDAALAELEAEDNGNE